MFGKSKLFEKSPEELSHLMILATIAVNTSFEKGPVAVREALMSFSAVRKTLLPSEDYRPKKPSKILLDLSQKKQQILTLLSKLSDDPVGNREMIEISRDKLAEYNKRIKILRSEERGVAVKLRDNPMLKRKIGERNRLLRLLRDATLSDPDAIKKTINELNDKIADLLDTENVSNTVNDLLLQRRRYKNSLEDSKISKSDRIKIQENLNSLNNKIVDHVAPEIEAKIEVPRAPTTPRPGG